MQELQGSRLSERRPKRPSPASLFRAPFKANAVFLFNWADAKNLNLYSLQIHHFVIFYASGSPLNIGPEGLQISLRAGRVSRGAGRRRSQLFLASCGSLITVQRSRRAARKMLIHQDLERWGLRRRERESADQLEATWDGALDTCMADHSHSHSHNPPFLVQRASQCSRGSHSLQKETICPHHRGSDFYQPPPFHP